MIPGLDIFLKTVRQGMPYDVASRKVEKTFHAPRRDKNGTFMEYSPFAVKVMDAHWKWYYTFSLKKEFKKFLKLGYKYVSYYGEYDLAGNVQTWDEFIKYSLGDLKYEEYKLAPWKRDPNMRYVQKDFENTRTGMMYGTGHVVGMEKPWMAYQFVKEALEELTPKESVDELLEG